MLFKSQLNHRDRNGSLWPFRLDGWDISGRDNKRLVRTCCRHSMRSEEDERLEPTVNDTRSCGLRRYQRESVHSRCWMKRGYCPPFVGVRLDASATTNREWHVWEPGWLKEWISIKSVYSLVRRATYTKISDFNYNLPFFPTERHLGSPIFTTHIFPRGYVYFGTTKPFYWNTTIFLFFWKSANTHIIF